MSNRAMSRSLAFWSGIELKIGSSGNSGSPGKYIWVTSRWVNARPKQGEVDVRRPPRVGVVAPWVTRRGWIVGERVAALVVG